MAQTETGLSTREQVLEELRTGDAWLLLAHEHPDGDALGSLSAMHRVLLALGKDVVSYIAADDVPLPYEYRWMPLAGVVTEPPADIEQRRIVFLDCGNIDRIRELSLRRDDGEVTINIDHHHDNTRFASINHVVADASCTAEIVWDLMCALGVEMTPEIGQALYVGVVTDTGRFMYENTTPAAHRMAAAIMDAGVDVHVIYRRLFEGVPQAKLDLLARGLANLERFDGGRVTLSQLTRTDYENSQAEDSLSEGVVDHLRSIEGTAVAGLVREVDTADGQPPLRKVSLRATDDRVDVSKIAREMGGGGHRRAAGFTTQLDFPALAEFVRRQVAQQL